MFAGFTQRNNFGMGGGTVSPPSAFPTRPIGQLGNFNLFATNFLAVTGITDSNIQSAINQLCTDLVNTGLMDKMIAVYPFVGGSATTHKYNLKELSILADIGSKIESIRRMRNGNNKNILLRILFLW